MQPYPTYQNYLYNPYSMNSQVQMPYQTNYSQQMSGRFVNDFSEVSANDVAMDRPSVFIKNDRSEIQVRNWDANGRINTTLYLPQIGKKDAEVDILSTDGNKSKFDAKSEVLDPLYAKLEELEKKIDKINLKEVADE